MRVMVGFFGKAGSGKDTSAFLLADALSKKGLTVRRIAFGDFLKHDAALLGWNGQKDEKGRTFLQQLGDVCREYNGEDFFVNRLFSKIAWEANEDGSQDVYMITDVRFRNEYKAMVERGAIMVKVVRKDEGIKMTEAQKHHISETAMDSFEYDVLVENTGTLEELSKHMTELADKIVLAIGKEETNG